MATNPLRIGRAKGTGGPFSIRLVNMKQVIRDLDEELDDAVDDIEDVLEPLLDKHFKEPSAKICPEDTGALKKSRYTAVTRTSKWNIDARVGYDTEYAIYVHENLDARHAPPTRAKWLEETIARNLDKFLKDLERTVRRMQRR
jgi:hypothetical protein